MKWLRRLKWWFYADVVQVRAFIEQVYCLPVSWDEKHRRILVNDKPIQKHNFRLYSDGRHYGYPRDIERSLKAAGFSL